MSVCNRNQKLMIQEEKTCLLMIGALLTVEVTNCKPDVSCRSRPFKDPMCGKLDRGGTSVARLTVSTLSPMRIPFSPAQATSVTLASAYTTNPYLHGS